MIRRYRDEEKIFILGLTELVGLREIELSVDFFLEYQKEIEDCNLNKARKLYAEEFIMLRSLIRGNQYNNNMISEIKSFKIE